MIQLGESYTEQDLTSYLQESESKQTIEEGAVKNWLTKTYNYLKGKIAKLGKFFVALWDDGSVLPTVTPLISQKAWLDGDIKDAKAVHMVGTSEDKKYSGVPTDGDDAISSRPSTLDVLKQLVSKHPKFECNYDLMNQNLITEEIKLKHSSQAIPNVDKAQLENWIKMVIRKPLSSKPILIWGAPGVGKTMIVKSVMNAVGQKGSRLIDVQLSLKEFDDFFLPSFQEVNGVKEAVDIPKSWLPVYEVTGDKDRDKAASEACGNGVIFFDELSRTKPQVMNVCLKLIGERMLGEKYRLGDGWAVIAASNRMEDDPETNNNLGAALGNRFMQFNYVPTFKSWRQWADKQKIMNQDILNWLECNEKYFYYNPDNDLTGEQALLFASPRSWENVCITLANFAATGDEEGFDIESLPDDMVELVIASGVGTEPAAAFMDYLKLKRTIDIASLEKVWTNPDSVKLPEKKNNTYKLDMMYIITTQILSLRSKKKPTPKEFANLCKYYARLDSESGTAKMLKDICNMWPELNAEFGEEIDGKLVGGDTYAEGIYIICQAYPEWDAVDWSSETWQNDISR